MRLLPDLVNLDERKRIGDLSSFVLLVELAVRDCKPIQESDLSLILLASQLQVLI